MATTALGTAQMLGQCLAASLRTKSAEGRVRHLMLMQTQALHDAINTCALQQVLESVEKGRYEGSQTNFEIGALLARTLLLDGCVVQLTSSCGECEELWVAIDGTILNVILREVGSNAEKYREPEKPITACAQFIDVAGAARGQLQITIENQNRKGEKRMSDSECARVFEAGFRCANATSTSTGLGLNTAAKVAQAAGGSIKMATREDDGGNIFTAAIICMPATRTSDSATGRLPDVFDTSAKGPLQLPSSQAGSSGDASQPRQVPVATSVAAHAAAAHAHIARVTPDCFTTATRSTPVSAPAEAVVGAAGDTYEPCGSSALGASPMPVHGLGAETLGIDWLRPLGSGGMGSVYCGVWLGTTVAVKVIRDRVGCDWHGASKERRQQALREEAIVLSQLRHPCICSFYGPVPLATADGAALALVLEFLPGGSLFRLLHQRRERQPLSTILACRIARETASGLAYLHANHYMHRDVKSGNILLDETGHAKVADFGLAKLDAVSGAEMEAEMHAISSAACHTGGAGTTRYMAPEVFRSATNPEPVYDQSCDTYSFGVLLWEILHEKRPFVDLTGAQTTAHVQRGGRPPLVLDGGCHPSIQQVMAPLIRSCWHQSAAERPAMASVARSLLHLEGAICASPPSGDLSAERVLPTGEMMRGDASVSDAASPLDSAQAEAPHPDNMAALASPMGLHTMLGSGAISHDGDPEGADAAPPQHKPTGTSIATGWRNGLATTTSVAGPAGVARFVSAPSVDAEHSVASADIDRLVDMQPSASSTHAVAMPSDASASLHIKEQAHLWQNFTRFLGRTHATLRWQRAIRVVVMALRWFAAAQNRILST